MVLTKKKDNKEKFASFCGNCSDIMAQSAQLLKINITF